MSSSRLTDNTLEFTNFKVEEGVLNQTLQVKEGTTTKATFNTNGILFDNSGSDLVANNMTAAIKESAVMAKTTAQVAEYDKVIANYKFSSITADSLMGLGVFRLNNAVLSNATQMYVRNEELMTNADLRNLFTLINGRLNVYIQKANDTDKFGLFNGRNINFSATNYIKVLNLNFVTGNNFTLSDDDECIILIAERRGFFLSGFSMPNIPLTGTGFHTLQFNSAGDGALEWKAVPVDLLPATYSVDATTVTVRGTGELGFDDNCELRVGTDNDLTISHDGLSTTTFLNTSQNLLFSNTNSFAYTKFSIGGTSPMSQIQFLNGNDDIIMNMGGDKFVNVQGYLYSGSSDMSNIAGTSRLAIWDSTFTDDSTLAGGTAPMWAAMRIRQQTLAAANTGVTTLKSASLWIDNAPATGTNQTLPDNLAIYVGAGDSEFKGEVTCATVRQTRKSTVTQTGVITDDVTINTRIGVINTVKCTTPAFAAETFTVKCSAVSVGDIVMITLQDYSGKFGDESIPVLSVDKIQDGQFNIVIMAAKNQQICGVLKIAYHIL